MDGTLDQVIVCHGSGCLAGLLRGGGLLNLHCKHPCGSFGIEGHLTGQVPAQIDEGFLEAPEGRPLFLNGAIAGKTGGQNHRRIIGALMAVHREPVERLVNGLPKGPGQEGLSDGGICCQDAQSCGHIGADHSGSLDGAG